MLCGSLPFVCKDDIAYLRAHIKEPAPAPSSVAPDAGISRAVDELVLRALEKDPEKRFKDANEMIAAIDVAGRHRPLEGRASGRLVAIAILLVLLAAALVMGARLVGAHCRPGSSARRRCRRKRSASAVLDDAKLRRPGRR